MSCRDNTAGIPARLLSPEAGAVTLPRIIVCELIYTLAQTVRQLGKPRPAPARQGRCCNHLQRDRCNRQRAGCAQARERAMTIKTDFTIERVYPLRCFTPAARQWRREHLPADALMFAGAAVLDARDVHKLVDAINAAGLTVGGD